MAYDRKPSMQHVSLTEKKEFKNMHNFWMSNYFWKCHIAASLAQLSALMIFLTLPLYLLEDSKNRSLQIPYGHQFLMNECPSPGTFLCWVCCSTGPGRSRAFIAVEDVVYHVSARIKIKRKYKGRSSSGKAKQVLTELYQGHNHHHLWPSVNKYAGSHMHPVMAMVGQNWRIKLVWAIIF